MATGPLMLDLHSTQITEEERHLLLNPLVGGVIYFSRNFESREQIQRLSAEIKSLRADLLIAVDQEGGRVQRFKDGFTAIPSMQSFRHLFLKKPDETLNLVRDVAWLMASEILSVGIDFSFAPVLDSDDCFCSAIADRSFSPDPAEVSILANAWIDGMKEAGMAVTGKHFPGHGQVAIDSHVDLPIDDRSLEEIETTDMRPFSQLMNKLDAIMPAHILFPKIDKNYTVGFSPYWLETILREKSGFDGVIFSDDLSMEGAASVGGYVERARLALSAGCDMILLCNQRQGALEVIEKLSHSMKSDSVKRLERMKSKNRPSFADLQSQSRWQATRTSILALV